MSHHKEGGGGIMVGTYYTPQMCKERNAFTNYSDKLREILLALQSGIDSVRNQILISTQTACSYPQIPSASVGYIFTDPPYGDRVQYGELNFVWEAWLGFDTYWHNEEIIVNDVREKTEDDWANLMREAVAECYRVLKPGRWLSLCYHDTSEGTWALVQDIMAEAGFLVDKSSVALFIDTGQKSYNQLTADKVTKRDLVINFRRPKLGEVMSHLPISGDEDESTFGEKVRVIIRDYLSSHPGSTKDRVYDEVVSRMVRAGRMEAHNFDELLAQVAEPAGSTDEGTRWYLKETALAVVDAAESAKEDAAAAKIAKFIAKRLKENPEEEGVHYSDLFEQFVYTVKDKPRRHLSDWLPDYSFQDRIRWNIAAARVGRRRATQGARPRGGDESAHPASPGVLAAGACRAGASSVPMTRRWPNGFGTASGRAGTSRASCCMKKAG